MAEILNLNGNTLTIMGTGATGGMVGIYGTNYITGAGSIVVNSGGNLAYRRRKTRRPRSRSMPAGRLWPLTDNNVSVAAPLTVNGGTIYGTAGTSTFIGNVLLNGTLTLANSYYI